MALKPQKQTAEAQTEWDAIEKLALAKTKNKLSRLAIGAAVARGKDFYVRTNAERKAALDAAQFMGVRLITRKIVGAEGYKIYAVK